MPHFRTSLEHRNLFFTDINAASFFFAKGYSEKDFCILVPMVIAVSFLTVFIKKRYYLPV